MMGPKKDWADEMAEWIIDEARGHTAVEDGPEYCKRLIATALREAQERGKDEAWAEAAELTEVALNGIEASIRSRSQQGQA